MGTITPTEKLVVMGNLSINNSAHGGITFFVDSTNNRTGIGTASPSHTLTVIGDLNVTGVSYLGDITINTDNITTNNIVSRNGNISLFNDSGDELMRITSLGKVGIGTTNPTETLSVIGNFSVSGNHSFFGGLNIGGDLVGTDGVGPNAVSSGWVDDGTVVRLIDATNKVGIGTSNPATALDVSGTVTATSFSGSGSALTGISSATPPWNSSGTNVYLNDSTAKVGIGTSSPNYLLDVAGTINASGLHIDGDANITGDLIVGVDGNFSGNLHVEGNITTLGADFAEMFSSEESLEAGDVVCLENNFEVKKCNKKSDTLVVGVVSSNPTITGNLQNGNYPIGIVGIVPTKVKGQVIKGNLLTSSSKEGYAEKATINDFGAIIGKAMEACYEDTGKPTDKNDSVSGNNSVVECKINVLIGLR
jgi:hypothetical protein